MLPSAGAHGTHLTMDHYRSGHSHGRHKGADNRHRRYETKDAAARGPLVGAVHCLSPGESELHMRMQLLPVCRSSVPSWRLPARLAARGYQAPQKPKEASLTVAIRAWASMKY